MRFDPRSNSTNNNHRMQRSAGRNPDARGSNFAVTYVSYLRAREAVISRQRNIDIAALQKAHRRYRKDAPSRRVPIIIIISVCQFALREISHA